MNRTSDLDYALFSFLLALGLFLSMMLFLEVGRRIGVRRIAQEAEKASAGVGTVDGAIFGLLGLLIAFTFSGASARFDTRRQLIISALLAGYGMASATSRSWLHMLGFSAALAAAVYVILDLEYPRFGLIRVDAFDQALVDLRESMQ